jgi:hypothetical protein
MWRCRCECGVEQDVVGSDLRSGHSQSCGCLRIERVVKCKTTHGQARAGAITSEYRIWLSAKTRCYNPKSNNYVYYGGRGIRMCDRWRDSFQAFLSDMGPRPSDKSIDRIDNDGPYSPSNCRWASRIEQRLNQRPHVYAKLGICHDGETLSSRAWARRYGLHSDTLRKRLKLGWEIHAALTTPAFLSGRSAQLHKLKTVNT